MLKDHISSPAFFFYFFFLFVNSGGSRALLSEKPSFAFVCFSFFNLAKSQQLGGERPDALPGAAMPSAFASQRSRAEP